MTHKPPIMISLTQKLDRLYQHFDWIILGLLVFILLIPKFPFISVSGTYVNVRIEDFVVVVIYGLWLIAVLAGRYSIKKVFNQKVLIIYLVYGLCITLLGITIFKTVDNPPLGFLHWVRRVEYFGIYFIAATVAKKENLPKYLYVLLGTGIITWVYGYLQWQDILPGVHTLSKSGQLGTYSDLGYVISTFAAHYDFGTFLMLMVMLCVWGYFSHRQWLKQLFFACLAFVFWWMARLVYGRAAYLGLLIGLVVILIIKMSGWVLLPLWEIIKTFDRYFGGKFSRYTYNFKFNILPKTPTPLPTPGVSGVTPTPMQSESYGLVERFLKPKYTVSPEEMVEQISSTGAVKTWLDEHVSQWSVVLRSWTSRLNINLDPSANIRLREWQDALARVGYHFMWGGGYTTMYGVGTDNDYVRKIVEVGVIGLAMFILIIWDFLKLAWKSYTLFYYPYFRYFHLAMIGFIVGLLVEAVFIDIFEASKIAFLFWYLMGVLSLFAVQMKEGKIE